MYRTAVPTLAVLAALTLACSSTPEHGGEFHRGTPTVRPAAPARPGVGAPVVGQPGSRSEVPRSPHQRILPPSKEPGVWAGDTKGSKRRREYELLGFPVPYPEEAKKYDDSHTPIAECSISMKAAAVTRGMESINRLSDSQKKCLSAKLFEVCIKKRTKRMASFLKASGIMDDDTGKLLSAIKTSAESARKNACDDSLSDSIEETFSEVVKIWRRQERNRDESWNEDIDDDY